jgi:hypothetical protein
VYPHDLFVTYPEGVAKYLSSRVATAGLVSQWGVAAAAFGFVARRWLWYFQVIGAVVCVPGVGVAVLIAAWLLGLDIPLEMP